ncbi:MAG: hypothetical protein P8129_25730 [Anaerolineae bacterium]
MTTIYQDLRKLGCTAVQQLVQAIEKSRQDPTPDDPDSRRASILLTPDLIVRASSLASGARDYAGQAAPAPEEKEFQKMETN